jgi:hypothetical protein
MYNKNFLTENFLSIIIHGFTAIAIGNMLNFIKNFKQFLYNINIFLISRGIFLGILRHYLIHYDTYYFLYCLKNKPET